MKLLFITSRFPYPPLKGDKIRAYYPIKLLSKKHQIDLLAFNEEKVRPENIKEMRRYCDKIDIVNLNKLLFTTALAFGIISPWPSQIICYKSLRMKKFIQAYIRNNNYDIVHIVCGRLVGYGRYIKNIPKVIDWIDSLSLSTERMYKNENSWLKKIPYYLEWKKMKRYEQKNISACDFSFITSQVDKNYVQNDTVAVIPNGVDVELFHPLNAEKDIDLVFTGNMGYFANVKAVEFFCKEVMPIILQKRPETRFYVVGINPSKEVLKYHDDKNVIVTGYVENLTKLLNRSKIFVAPLRSGAGIQNKILEAMACKLPVVSTSYGNSGIQAKEKKEIIIRDNPPGFADAILYLLSDNVKRYTLGSNGHELVKKNFSWKSMTDRLFGIYIDIFRKKSSTKLKVICNSG